MSNLFFGAEIQAPWPDQLPEGRLIKERERHLTLAFLGNHSFTDLEKILPSFPLPPFKVGIVGKSSALLTLPEKSSHPRVIAYQVDWLKKRIALEKFQEELKNWLLSHHFQIEKKRDFLSHVTIARAPFKSEEWEKSYYEIPFAMQAIHLYESRGENNYYPLWSYPLIPAFEEFEHTADIAFMIRAETIGEIHLHAQIALAFKFPSLLRFLFLESLKENLDEIIISLNESVSKADQLISCPFKAVSFHGAIKKNQEGIFEWEMIIDV